MAQQSVTPEKKSRFDGLKWLLIVALLVAAIVAEFYYSQVAWAIRRPVAQLAEQRSPKPQVGGSIPSWPANESWLSEAVDKRKFMAQQSVTPEKKSRFDGLKWLLIVALLVAAIVAEFYYSQVAWAIRAAVGIVVVVILLAIASQTDKGRRAWGFIKNARTELRKVVWPTRQETLQTTLVVIVMVVITALILWGLDSFFMWAIGWMAGQRG